MHPRQWGRRSSAENVEGASTIPVSVTVIPQVLGLFTVYFINMHYYSPLFTLSTAVWKLSDSEETEIKIDLYQEWLTVWSLIVHKNSKISLFIWPWGIIID